MRSQDGLLLEDLVKIE